MAPCSVSLRAQTGYPGYKFIHTGFPKYFAPYLSTYHNTYNTRHSQSVRNFLNAPKFNLKFTSPLSSLVSVSFLMLLLSGIHYLKTFMHHPLLPHLERSSKPISTQRLILFSSFSLLASLWCQSIYLYIIKFLYTRYTKFKYEKKILQITQMYKHVQHCFTSTHTEGKT